jgi:hypothetical protein
MDWRPHGRCADKFIIEAKFPYLLLFRELSSAFKRDNACGNISLGRRDAGIFCCAYCPGNLFAGQALYFMYSIAGAPYLCG